MEHDATPIPLFVFAGGGTGGHLFPGIAVADALVELEPRSRILFVSTGRPVEITVLAEFGFDTQLMPTIRVSDLLRHPIRFASSFWRATRVCKQLVRDRKPAAIIGLGGVASVPLIRVAKGIPVVLLEQNVLPGRTTRWLAKQHPVLMSFERTRKWLPNSAAHVATGNPVQASIRQLFDQEPLAEPPQKKALLVLGGSQGSKQVNDAVLACATELRGDLAGWSILHQTGPGEADRIRDAYAQLGLQFEVQEFFSNMASVYQRATIAIARSGATTLAELAIAGVPAIFIPYPEAKDDHQTLNAQHFVEAEAAFMVNSHDRENVSTELRRLLSSLVSNAPLRTSMRTQMRAAAVPDAAQNVAREILARVRANSGTNQ